MFTLEIDEKMWKIQCFQWKLFNLHFRETQKSKIFREIYFELKDLLFVRGLRYKTHTLVVAF